MHKMKPLMLNSKFSDLNLEGGVDIPILLFGLSKIYAEITFSPTL